MTSTRRFEGKIAFITGAARGQGRAEAIRLAGEGADIIAVDICKPLEYPAYPGATPDDLAVTVKEVEALGRRIVAREVDVRDFDALQQALSEGVAELGGLDVVIANAGVCSAATTWEHALGQWQEIIDINLTGVFHTAKAAVPILLEQGRGGAIVMTSSVAGLRGLPFVAAYSASKHGVVGLCKTLANELGQHRIRVNTVHPAGVNTDMQPVEMQQMIADHADTLGPIFMNALPDTASEPEDIATTVAWLASDDARHITGAQIPVDMGTLIR
jgi:SDR family mycofactocin-dependent oxidoreductase